MRGNVRHAGQLSIGVLIILAQRQAAGIDWTSTKGLDAQATWAFVIAIGGVSNA
jgi:hypothetical protein